MTYGVRILWGGPDYVIEDESGSVIKFEDHPRCGPVVLNRDGSVKATQPGERAPFWRVWEWWVDGGKKVENGRCIWVAPPPPPKLVWLGGRNYAEEGSDLAKRFGRPKPGASS